MLELGKTIAEGVRDKLTPVLRDGGIVASLRAPGWRSPVSATVGDRSWVFGQSREELTGTEIAVGRVRFRAARTEFAGGTWGIELDGEPVQMDLVSARTGTHRFTAGGEPLAATASSGWSAELTLTAEPGVPLDRQVFLLWVALVTRRRNTPAVGV